MRIVAARDLVPAAPSELPALLVLERSADGATRRICVAGDVSLSGRIAKRLSEDPFREVAPVLRQADLRFANLESTLLDRSSSPRAGAGELFRAPATAAQVLASAGFDLLNLANNHVLDYGTEGLAATREAIRSAGLEVLGAGPDPAAARRPVVTDLGGLRLGWLGCARTLKAQEPAGESYWEYAPGELEAAIREARAGLDVLVVSIHMGYMFVDYPHPGQRLEILALLSAGADLVVMHHAHVLQGVELAAGGGLACYNLGNFLFDWTEGEIAVAGGHEEQRRGGVFVFDLDRRGVSRALVLPTRVDDGWTVRWALGQVGRAILERLTRVSSGWQTGTAGTFHRQLADRATGLAAREAVTCLRRGGPRAVLDLARRLRGHHLRMLAGWPAQRLGRWLRRRRP